ncbi:glycoside hydrolase family 18 protein [Gonapodya prolifera JEL478]|uniref:Glycoside hydrolase family 18 protein n=1 Tax=Gonapodya prolifera (strain JEL478) TaxID=1344416 RepID=A0A139AJF5_GONPJ|nr:glycoside hydrolase family 18 protein [Gonapodya prolifera JEL478]|eukprot:KXS16930.1 glycoside hydrolase family 18 protein [Gonapodya prolifera JEL478]
MRLALALCGALAAASLVHASPLPDIGLDVGVNLDLGPVDVDVSASVGKRAPPKQGGGVVAFYPNWALYSRSNISGIDLTGVDTVVWAFWTVRKDGSILTTDEWADFQVGGTGTIPLLNAAKKKYGFRTMLSIGGWSSSANFSAVAVNPAARKTFTQACLKACQDYGFDGVDLDWEYPGGGGLEMNYFSLGDPEFYVQLLKDLRSAFGSKYLISIDVSASSKRYDNQLWAYGQIVDWINIMGFDYVGTLQPISGHNSPLYEDKAGDPGKAGFVSQAVSAYIAAGVNPKKLTLLTPFYGKSWNVTSGSNNGLYQLVDVYDADQFYSSLRKNGWLTTPTTAGAGFQKTYWDSSHAPTLLRKNSEGSYTFVTYDDPSTITEKARLAKSMGFGGVGMWEITQDYQGELLTALVGGFKK